MIRMIKKRIRTKVNKKYCAGCCSFLEDFMDYQQCALFGKKLKNKNKALKRYFPVIIRCSECVKLLTQI